MDFGHLKKLNSNNLAMTSNNQHRLAHSSSFQEDAPRLPRVWIESHSSGCGIHRKTKFLSSTHLLDFLFLTCTWWKLRLVPFSDKCLHVLFWGFFWWMISGRWKVAHDLLHTTQPVTRAEHTSGLLIFSSAILRQHFKATKAFFFFFGFFVIWLY